MKGNLKISPNKFKSKIKFNLPHPYVCKICNKELKSIPGLASHLKNAHTLDYGKYLKTFYDFDVEALNKEWESHREERQVKRINSLKKCADKIRGVPLKNRMSVDQYKNFRKNMKGVFSKEWYVNKFGDTKGIIEYEKRSKNLSKKTHWIKFNKENKQNWSKISQELFWKIYESIQFNFKNIYFGELNHEYSCAIHNCNFDFVVKDNKKIIEFNGDKFHANPKLYKNTDIPLKFIGRTSQDIWKFDELKIENVKSKGYDLKIVWESDYIENKEQVLKDCINFIMNYGKNS
jgi:hypothetical protein